MTRVEMKKWLEDRGSRLRSNHTKGELETFINRYCEYQNIENPLEKNKKVVDK